LALAFTFGHEPLPPLPPGELEKIIKAEDDLCGALALLNLEMDP
jgi:hypothetical protein